MIALTFGQLLKKTLIFVFSLNTLVIVSNYLAVSDLIPHSPITQHFTQLLLGISLFAFVGVLGGSFGIPVSLIAILWKRYRRFGCMGLLVCSLFFLSGIACFKLALEIRRNGFVDLANRSRPLIKAVESFEERYGKPPSRLEDLVPDYLSAVPDTRMAAYPDYKYVLADDRANYFENNWILQVDTPSGGLGWDIFIYFPNQKYPRTGFGGVLERIEDWAYVHE